MNIKQIIDEGSTRKNTFQEAEEKQAACFQKFSMLVKETLNKAGPVLSADRNLIRETTLHNFAA